MGTSMSVISSSDPTPPSMFDLRPSANNPYSYHFLCAPSILRPHQLSPYVVTYCSILLARIISVSDSRSAIISGNDFPSQSLQPKSVPSRPCKNGPMKVGVGMISTKEIRSFGSIGKEIVSRDPV